MALGPVDYRRAMAGRLPGARPQATGTSPQVERAAGAQPATQHGVVSGVMHPSRPATDATAKMIETSPATRAQQPIRAAVARSQSANPGKTKAAALTAGPQPPAPSPKRAVSAAPAPATSLTSAASGMPARMMKKGGLVRKGNVSHGKYTKRC